MTTSRRIRLLPLVLIGLAVLAALVLIPRVVQAQNQTPDQNAVVWSADMLVVEYTENSIGAASADLFSNIGGTGDLEIRSLWSHVPNRDIRLAFQEGIPDADDLTLVVGDLTLEFPPGSSGNGSFKWTDMDVDWEDGQTISVSIVLTSALQTSASNTPATGAPTISGTAQVGETLTAETSDIADEDGLEGVSYSYQWTRSDGSTYADLAGETDSTYTLVFADQGKTIKVRVSFTDDADNEETLTSEATVSAAAARNRPATGAPTISGTAQVGETLTAETSDIADEDGLTNTDYSYQWISGGSDIDGATGSSYTLTSSELGKTLKVTVTFTDDADNQESLISVATTAVTRPPPSRAPEMDSISVHDGRLRISGGRVQLSDSSVPAADVGSYISSFKVQWKSGSQEYDATRQAVLAPETVTGNVAYYAFMPSHDITGLTNDVEYTVRVMATNAGGDGSPSQEQTATPSKKSEQLRQYIEDEIVEEHESSHPWLRRTWNYLQNNNIPLNVWNSDWWPKSTYFDNSSGIGARYVRSLDFSESTVDAAEAEKKETILINLADIYTMTNGVSSSPAPLGIAHVYFRTVDTLSLSGCWDSRLYLDVMVSLVTHDSLAGASDWNRCVARSEDATAMAVVRSALSGQTPDWFADTYHDSDGNPDLEQFWVVVQLVDSEVVAYQLRNSFGGYCDADPNWGLRITRSLNRSLASAGFDTLVNPWRDGGCVPSAPISLTASLEEDGTASVSWEAPESNGGVLLSGYKIQWQPVQADEGTTPQIKHVYFDDYSDEARPAEVSETIDGLTDGVDYTVRVLAYNPNGDGTAAEVTVSEPNAAPTGLPTISGTAQVGETLTAETSDIADEDGLTNTDYSYQWISGGSDIDGATGSSYTLTSSELGKTLKVTVTFTDDADNQETLTSEATGAVAATVSSAPQSITVTSGSQIQELDVAWQAPSSDGGSDVTGYKVQWKESADSWDTEADVSEATVTGTTHTITGLTGGVEYVVRVIATNVAGDGPASTEARATPADSTAAWTATLTVGVSGSGSEAVWGYSWFRDGMGTLDERTYNEGDQTIEVMAILLSNGFVAFTVRPHPSVDFVLTVDGTEFASADASEVKSRALISYVWATTLDWAEDDRVALSLTLKDTDSVEQSEPAENTPATGKPTIGGTPQVDQTLTADTSNIDDEDGLTNVSYRYQWSAGGSDIEGATGSTYTLTYSEQGQTIQVQVSFTDDADNEETLTSAATVAVAAAPNRGATGQPTISGTPQVGQTLTADTSNIADLDGITNPTFAYQWRGGGLTIIGATGSTYTLTASDQGKTITVRVRFIDDRNSIESRISNATTAVAAAPNREATGAPTIGGTPQVDQTLTADTANIADEDGLTNVSYSYQWIAGGSDIAGATGSSYTLTSSEEGQTVQVRVTFTDDADNEETLTSVATDAVAAAPVPLTVRLKVAAPTTHDGSSEFTFEIEFSEEFGLSYVTLRDFAFTETGGEVRKAQRMDKPSNIRWLITVEPNGNGDVTIVLPVTTDCNADGAICTGDGRKLSNSLSFTVSGPGG